MKGLTLYLNKYYKMQKDIILVYRQDESSSWSDRCLFLGEKYSPHKSYNHRSILQNEIVIEFDEDSKEDNDKLATWVCSHLNEDKIAYSRWRSGNKSQHIHMFININNAVNLPLLKNSFMRYYGTFYRDKSGALCKDKPASDYRKILPDLRLCSVNHLIRAENGLHEKAQQQKSLMYSKNNFPDLNEIPESVWDRYQMQQRINASKRLTKPADNDELTEKIKVILNTSKFRQFEDGRERALFILIHYLKPSYTTKKEELVAYLCEWYKYSGGYKLDSGAIRHKINYHWNRSYQIETILDELLETIAI